MKKVKTLNIKQLAELIGASFQTLRNWKNSDDHSYRMRREVVRIGGLAVANDITYEKLYLMIQEANESDIIDENQKLKDELETIKEKAWAVIDEARDHSVHGKTANSGR